MTNSKLVVKKYKKKEKGGELLAFFQTEIVIPMFTFDSTFEYVQFLFVVPLNYHSLHKVRECLFLCLFKCTVEKGKYPLYSC